MIDCPTVLVLGAGASVPYGFPTACGLLQRAIDGGVRPAENPPNHRPDLTSQRARDFERFAGLLRAASVRSIDQFVRSNRRELEVAKWVTASALIPQEDPQRLLMPVGIDADSLLSRDRWYGDFADGLGHRLEDLSRNRITVVTFNYDRSLEHFLTTHLCALYNVAPADAWAAIKEYIPIIHVYGSLGEYSPGDRLSDHHRPYTPQCDLRSAAPAVQALRLIHEFDPEDKIGPRVDADIAAAMGHADRVIVLGCSFDENNVRRLQLQQLGRNVPIFSSCYGLTRLERDTARGHADRIVTWGEDCHMCRAFLRHFVRWDAPRRAIMARIEAS